MKVVYLVACCATKLDRAAPACELYCSDWFGKAWRYCVAHNFSWTSAYILSARHGLVRPLELIAPYQATLKEMPAGVRREWGERVRREIVACCDLPSCRFVFFAGKNYRDPLAPLLRAGGAEVAAPLAGLGIGEQLAWFVREERRMHPFDENGEG